MQQKVTMLENDLNCYKEETSLPYSDTKAQGNEYSYNYNYNIYGIQEKKYNSISNCNSNSNRNLEFGMKKFDTDTNKLIEEIKLKNKIIFDLEKKLEELKQVNKTCYELLGQLSF